MVSLTNTKGPTVMTKKVSKPLHDRSVRMYIFVEQ